MMRNVSCPVRRGADGKGPGHRNLASRLPYNLLDQLHGARALADPVNTLNANGFEPQPNNWDLTGSTIGPIGGSADSPR